MVGNSYFYDFIPVKYNVSDSARNEILTEYPSPKLPSSGDFFNIQDMKKGSNVSVRLLLNDFKVHLTKHNKQFLRINFSNNLGIINAIIWDNQGEVERYKPLLEEFSIFYVEGTVSEFNRRKSITISKLTPHKEDINPFSLLPYTQQSLSELTVELFAYLGELESPFREISLAAMNHFWTQFRISPAAKGFHHNYLGGLLKHTVGLMRFARYILKFDENHFQAVIKLISVVEKAYKNELWDQFQSENNNNLVWKDTIDHLYTMFQGMTQFKEVTPNYNIVITSILFHDIGKLLEYDHAGQTYEEFNFLFPTASNSSVNDRKQTGITMDELGVMVGHIPYGFLIFNKIIESEKTDISLEDIHQVSHCILCHHGLPEWGSCVRNPQTIEGYIIHIVDFLDSRYENTEEIK